jgi:hypothetical protein
MEHLGVVWVEWAVSVKRAYDPASVCKRGETQTLAAMRNYTVTEFCFFLLPHTMWKKLIRDKDQRRVIHGASRPHVGYVYPMHVREIRYTSYLRASPIRSN